jgi:hypothetical protein
LNLRTGLRIASHPSFSFGDFESPKPDDADRIPFFECLGDSGKNNLAIQKAQISNKPTLLWERLLLVFASRASGASRRF